MNIGALFYDHGNVVGVVEVFGVVQGRDEHFTGEAVDVSTFFD